MNTAWNTLWIYLPYLYQFYLTVVSFAFMPVILNYVFHVCYTFGRFVERQPPDSGLWAVSIGIPGMPPLPTVQQLLVSLSNRCCGAIAATILQYARVWHSFELVGVDRIPSDRAALLIFYHGTLVALDMVFVPMAVYVRTGRLIRNVSDRALWGFTWAVGDYSFPGPVDKCVRVLTEGHLLQIASGGGRECLFASRHRYEPLWNGRTGFARVALEAGVEVVPVFTRNCRHVFLVAEWMQHLSRPLYEFCRASVVPAVGPVPVKLVTYVGQPIRVGLDSTVWDCVELAGAIEHAMLRLIDEHQHNPKTVLKALMERFSELNEKLD